MFKQVVLSVFLLHVVSASLLFGQAASAERPTIRALRLAGGERIDVDGLLEESAWARAAPITEFRQSDPNNGEPATERSEIRVLLNADNLYIGAQFFDSDPSGMLGNQMVRDGFLSGDDRFMWVLDPFNNQTSGYFFEINPAGAMGDSQLVPAQGRVRRVAEPGVGRHLAGSGPSSRRRVERRSRNSLPHVELRSRCRFVGS